MSDDANRITTLQTQNEMLQYSNARLQQIIQLTTDFAYSLRIEPDGTFIHEWDAGDFQQLTGFTFEEAHRNGGPQCLVHPDDAAILAGRNALLLAGQQAINEYRIITRDGAVRWLHDSACPVWDETREAIIGICGAVQDITERKQAEAALQQRIAELEQQIANA